MNFLLFFRYTICISIYENGGDKYEKSIFLGLCISLVVSFSCTAFGTTAEVLGDISMGNHKNAPYSQSNIIVPRPSSSKYLSMPLYNNTSIPSDIKGHWAESYIKYFLEKGYISLENNKFNTP